MRVIDEELLAAFRRKPRCEYCGRAAPSGLDPHHVFSRGAGRLDLRINLIGLCRSCHQDVHSGAIMQCDVLAVVAAREGLLQDDIRRMVWAVRRAPKGSDLTEVLRKLQ